MLDVGNIFSGAELVEFIKITAASHYAEVGGNFIFELDFKKRPAVAGSLLVQN